jgi:ABC-type sugar transport system ATPase subunit
MTKETPLIEMKNITKTFGPVIALRDTSLELMPKEVLGLVGDNAAGKSTLMKVLSGAILPDKGEIYVKGKKVHIKGPEDSRNMGIEMIYQDFALANNLDVASNIYLGREIKKKYLGFINLLDKKKMEEGACRVLDRIKIDLESVKTEAEHLSGGQRQSVAIGRATAFDAQVIIMDEPTASLSIKTIGELLGLIMQLKKRGISIIIISHRLQDIFTVSDRIMVLKTGKRVTVKKTKETNIDEIISLMVKDMKDSNNEAPAKTLPICEKK